MNCSPSKCKEELRQIAADAGFYAFGVAEAKPVDEEAFISYEQWLADGNAGCMNYLSNHLDIRRDPRLLLDGAKSIIVLAMSYYHPEKAPQFAMYAHGDDYHEVLRSILKPVAEYMAAHGHTCRICVDSAPMLERYWATAAGIGFTGKNSMLIIPGAGSYFFLCEIVTSMELPPDEQCISSCGDCDRCRRGCPGKAITDAGFNANRCHSYLSIEYRGEIPEDVCLHSVYGCDVCQRVCPHNANPPVTPLRQFNLRPEIAALTVGDIESMTQPEFSAIFRNSAVKRAKLGGLLRNAKKLKSGK